MDILDSDQGFLKDSLGNQATRDIVQFVPFKKYKNNPIQLRKEVLAELPQQIVTYFMMNNIKPQKGQKITIFKFECSLKEIYRLKSLNLLIS